MTEIYQNSDRRQGISGAVLKWTAVITMLIDHLGAAVFVIYTSRYRADHTEAFANADTIYQIFRDIGRTAFPIFCFLLVEGFYHTRHVARYIGRLFLFCILSEIPFDLALRDKWCDFSVQNVYWTLLLGLMAVALLDYMKRYFLCRRGQDKGGLLSVQLWQRCAVLAVMLLFMLLASLMKTDYNANGVALILIFYFLRENKAVSLLVGYLSMIWEYWCFPGFILMFFYNGERGRQPKYFFYLFYPCHLFLLYLLRIYLLK